MKQLRIFFICVVMIFMVVPVIGDTVFNVNQTVPNSCVIDVIGVSANSVSAKANWTLNTYNCAAGTYLPAGVDWENDDSGCIQCPVGSYCIGGQFTYNESGAQGITTCPTGYTSDAGASAENQCFVNVTGGYYIGTAGQNSANWVKCAAGTYKAAHTVNYGSTSSCDACPDPATHKRTTFPENYYSPQIGNIQITGAGATNITQCKVLLWMSGARGKLYEYATYNTSTEKYDVSSGYGWHAVNPGYYLTNKGGCGAYAYYRDIVECPVGNYCPGKSSVVCNSDNAATVHTTNFGLESCPSGYTSATGATAENECFVNVDGGHYIGTAGQNSTNWETCAAGYAKAAHTVNYGSTSSCDQCTTDSTTHRPTYSSAGASSCSVCPAVTGTLAGRATGTYGTQTSLHTSINQCYAAFTDDDDTGTYVMACYYNSADGGYGGPHSYCDLTPARVSACAAGYGSAISGFVHTYGVDGLNGQVCTQCAAGTASAEGALTCTACSGRTQYSAAGAASCSTVSSGYYTTGCTGDDNCTGQSQCTGATYCENGVQNNCPTGYDADTSNGKNANTQCKINVTGGHYIGTAGQNSTNWATCAAGTYKAAHTVNYNNTSSCDACPSGYTSATGSTIIGQCQINCPANKYIANGTYTRLEYLESTGTQYIDTGITVKATTLAEFEYQFVGSEKNYVFGQVAGSGGSVLGYRTNTIWWFRNTNVSLIDNNKHTIVFNQDGNVYKDGTPIATRGTFGSQQSQTILLFAERNDSQNGNINEGKVKIYNFKLKEGATPVAVLDLVPVRRNSDNVLGMLDLVSGQFLTNAGTGTFVAGNDVGGIGGTCAACPTGYNSIARTITYGDASICDPNIINISWHDASGGLLESGTCTYDGQIVTPVSEPVKNGYTFTGWTLTAQ